MNIPYSSKAGSEPEVVRRKEEEWGEVPSVHFRVCTAAFLNSFGETPCIFLKMLKKLAEVENPNFLLFHVSIGRSTTACLLPSLF